MAAFYKLRIFQLSEDEINLRSFTQFSKLIFRLIFFYFEPLSENSTLKENFLHFVRKFHVQLFMFCSWIGVALMLTRTVVTIDDFVTSSRSFLDACASSFIAMKMLTSFFRRENFNEFFREIEALIDLHDDQKRKRKVKKYLDNYNWTMQVFAVNYLYAYAWVVWLGWNDMFALFGTDIMFFALTTVIAMKFDLLVDDIKSLLSWKTERARNIKLLIDHHNQLLDLSDKLQKIYSTNILSSFVVSSIVIGFTAFQLSTTVNNFDTFAFYAPYMCMMLGHILLLCFYSQKLIDSSESIADGIYNSNWEDIEDNGLKKELTLIILRAQRAKQLTAMNFFGVSRETFTAVSFNAVISVENNLNISFADPNNNIFISFLVKKSFF